MDKSKEKLGRIVELSDQIREKLFGYGYEDFRTNRKLKIEIIPQLMVLIEAIEDAGEMLSDVIPSDKFQEIYQIKNKIISGATGISEEYIWQLCKKELLLLNREIKRLSKENGY